MRALASTQSIFRGGRLPETFPGWDQEGFPPYLPWRQEVAIHSWTLFSSPFDCLPFLSVSFASLRDFLRPRSPKGSPRPPKVHPIGYHLGSVFRFFCWKNFQPFKSMTLPHFDTLLPFRMLHFPIQMSSSNSLKTSQKNTRNIFRLL